MADRQTTTERGYGADHKAEKERWRPIVNRGEAYCAETICLEDSDGLGRWIKPGTPWHLAHAEGQVGYRGPAHARCNISEASRRMHAAKAQQSTPTTSKWWRPFAERRGLDVTILLAEPTRHCEWCERDLNPMQARYCSRPCYTASFYEGKTSPVYFKVCETCGHSFTARRSALVRCGSCRVPYERRAKVTRPCETCGLEATGTRAKRYCSKRCHPSTRAKPSGAQRRKQAGGPRS